MSGSKDTTDNYERDCIVTRRDRVRGYAESFRQGFEATPYWGMGWPHLNPPLPPAAETYARLAALGDSPDPDDVDFIMRDRPNPKVSYGSCDGCGEDVPEAVEFDINCGEFKVELCASCCERLARKLRAAKIDLTAVPRMPE